MAICARCKREESQANPGWIRLTVDRLAVGLHTNRRVKVGRPVCLCRPCARKLGELIPESDLGDHVLDLTEP